MATPTERAGMKLRDRPEFASKPPVLTFTAETKVSEAVAAMSEKNYGAVVVVDGDRKVKGIVTERDIMKKLVNKGLDAGATDLSRIMTTELRMAKETDDVVDWLRIMSNERFRRLPVVDAEGRIKAIFSQGDFVSYTWPDLMYQAGNLARATIGRNFPGILVIGGILLYSLLMVVVAGLIVG